MLSDEEKKEYIEHEILDRLYCLEENDFDKNKVDDGYIKAVLNACKEAKNLIEKQSKEIEELEEDRNYLLIEGAKLVGDKEILKQTFEDSTKMFYIHKDKLRKIIYPSPENPIPIEVQQSEMYKKLMEEINNVR